MAVQLKGIYDRIVVIKLNKEETTTGGLILPDQAKEKPNRGKVVSVGKGALDEKGNRKPMYVQEGQTVVFMKYAGTDVKIEGVDYTILGQRDVLAVEG